MNGQDDHAQFARVVLPHLADAYVLARWLTGDRTDAEDVVQDACLRAFRGIAGFRGDNARAWVLTIRIGVRCACRAAAPSGRARLG